MNGAGKGSARTGSKVGNYVKTWNRLYRFDLPATAAALKSSALATVTRAILAHRLCERVLGAKGATNFGHVLAAED